MTRSVGHIGFYTDDEGLMAVMETWIEGGPNMDQKLKDVTELNVSDAFVRQQ